MSEQKTCFVISPIDEDESPIRKEVDGLLWIIKNALEKYKFRVLRIDKIPRSSPITKEIIENIRTSELCIIVLTGENPNVFYQAGRRHETGKPFIQMIRKGERLPFDLAGIRTIIYDDVDSRIAIEKIINEIRDYVETYEKEGYGTVGSSVSMSTLADKLDRVERQVGKLLNNSPVAIPTQPMSLLNTKLAGALGQADKIGLNGMGGLITAWHSSTKNPLEAYTEAAVVGDISTALTFLPQIEQILPPLQFLTTIAILPPNEVTISAITRTLLEHLEEFDLSSDDESLQVIKFCFGGAISFYSRRDEEQEAFDRFKPIFDYFIEEANLSYDMQAWFLNQLQRLLYGMDRYEEALSVAEKTLALSPDDSSYLYNASLIYEKLGLTQRAAEMVDRYITIGTEDDDHLMHAVQAYIAVEKFEQAREAFTKLESVSDFKAMLIASSHRDVLLIS
jgi:hypothetical protein